MTSIAVAGMFLVDTLATAQAPTLEHVTLQLKWKHQFQFAGYYAAIEQGFYHDAGLDVSLLEAQSGKDYTEPVLSGQAEFGVASSELVVMRAKGKPVVALAPIYQHSPLVLIVSDTADVDNVHELAGKRVMIAPEEAELFAYFQAEGLDPHTLKLLPHTYDPQALVDGNVDAISGYSTDEPYDLEGAGRKFSLFRPRSGGIDFYGDTLFTTEQQLSDHPDRVRNFLEASLKGWRYAFAHKEEVVDLILAKYTQAHTREHLLFEAAESERLIQPELVEIGYENPGRWRNIAETYARLGQMPPQWNIEGLVYERHPHPDYAWLLGALLVALATIGFLSGLTYYYHRLNATIREQSAALQQALDEVRTIQGILPICSYCKKIRDDKGAWKQIEHYIADHSEAEFSHGICSECYPKVRGELDAQRAARKRGEPMSTPLA